jgi:hypothetical protein
MFRLFGGKDWFCLRSVYGLKWMLKSCIALIDVWYPSKRQAKGYVPYSVESYIPWVSMRHRSYTTYAPTRCVVHTELNAGPVMGENVMRYGVSHVTSHGRLASRPSCKPNFTAYDEILSSFKICLIVVLGLSHWRVCFFRSHTMLAMYGVLRGFLKTGDSAESNV